TRPLQALLLLPAFACGGIPDSETAILNGPTDASLSSDVAGSADLGSPSDQGSSSDLGTSTDARADASVVDTATLADTVTPIDVTPIVDLGPPDVPLVVPCFEPGGLLYGGHCYFPTDTFSWIDASNFCGNATPPAHLATITSDGEQTAVQDLQSGQQRWIGLSRKDSDPSIASSFKWVTGEPAIYQHWYSDPTDQEPNGTGPCARFLEDGTWADYTCDSLFVAICERD
ncbi:MAG: C-type lectin domain-containing protein, partial [Polyangiales bacterium]